MYAYMHMYVCLSVCLSVCMYVYIYIYRERERDLYEVKQLMLDLEQSQQREQAPQHQLATLEPQAPKAIRQSRAHHMNTSTFPNTTEYH